MKIVSVRLRDHRMESRPPEASGEVRTITVLYQARAFITIRHQKIEENHEECRMISDIHDDVLYSIHRNRTQYNQ